MLQFRIIVDEDSISLPQTQAILKHLRDINANLKLHTENQEAFTTVYRMSIERKYGQKLEINHNDYPFVLLIRDEGKVIWYAIKPELEEIQEVAKRLGVSRTDQARSA